MSDHQTIADGLVVGVHYTLTDSEGETIDASGDEPLEYLHGADNIVAGLERALDGRPIGDRLDVVVAPEDAYGPREDIPLQQVPRDQFPADADIGPGTQFFAEDENGEVEPVWVVEVDDEAVLLDIQHPLAGVELHFAVEVLSLRQATPEELEHGHPHGPGGHHH